MGSRIPFSQNKIHGNNEHQIANQTKKRLAQKILRVFPSCSSMISMQLETGMKLWEVLGMAFMEE
jgi:hypothetical protein